MALQEFFRQRYESKEELNKYLEENLGIKSYTELAPVILVQSKIGIGALPELYPIVLSQQSSSDSEIWSGVVAGEDPSNSLRFANSLEDGITILIPGPKRGEWKLSDGNYYGGKYLTNDEIGRLEGRIFHRKYFSGDFLPDSLYYMGILEDRYTRVRRILDIADFGGDQLVDLDKFRAAQWLRQRISSGKFVPPKKTELSGSKEAVTGSGQ